MTLINRAIWQIEMRLAKPLSLHDLARRCAVSPYHLARCFRAATGLTPITYHRSRRLSRAAHAIVETDSDIVEIALDAQYGSHEAFTRAFVARFGVSPSTLRTLGTTETLCLVEPLKMDNAMITDIPAPAMREREAFLVVGLSLHCAFDDTSGIPALWQSFNSREDEVPDAVASAAYGVCCDVSESGQFRYLAGVESTARAGIPADMDRVHIPAGRYAVFTHRGHVSDLPKTVYTIWNTALSEHGLNPKPVPDFELYDQRFDVTTGRGDIEIWIPVE